MRNLNLDDLLAPERTVTIGQKEYAVKDLCTADAFVVNDALKAIIEHEDYDQESDDRQWAIIKTYLPGLPKKEYDKLEVRKKAALMRYLTSPLRGDGEEKNAD